MWKPKYSFKYMNSFIGNNVILKLSTNINIRIGKFLSVSKQNVDGDYTVQITVQITTEITTSQKEKRK